jgi:hypothetical protein
MCRDERGDGTRHGVRSLTIVNVCGRGRAVVAVSPWMGAGGGIPSPLHATP